MKRQKRFLSLLMACGLATIVTGLGGPPGQAALMAHGRFQLDHISAEIKYMEDVAFRRQSRYRARPGHTRPSRNRPRLDRPLDRQQTGSNDKGHTDKPRHRSADIPRVRSAGICINGAYVKQRCRCKDRAAPEFVAGNIVKCRIAKGTAVIAAHPVQASDGALAATLSKSHLAPTADDSAAAPAGNAAFVPDEILVSVTTTAPPAIDEAIGTRYGLRRLASWNIGLIGRRVIRYRIFDDRAVAEVLAAMRSEPQILASQPNYTYRQQGNTADVSLAELQYALAKLNVPAAHRLTRGRGAVVAILDSGIDHTHQDLEGSVRRVFSATEDISAMPNDPHGTEVGGIIAAHGAIKGVAPEASLLDVRVFERVQSYKEKRATTVSLLRGLDWSVSEEARIVNMSLTGPADPLVRHAIETAARQGVILVAAAGNDGAVASPAYPGAYPDVIAVTATDFGDSLYSAANRGSYIDVAAPGVDVLSPALQHAYRLNSGTSFAAAHVSGVIALILGRDPHLNAKAIQHALEAGTIDLGPPGVDPEFGAGRVDAFAALQAQQLGE